jgi:hypothetical protein
MSFFPEGYTPSQGGGTDYTKLPEGTTRLRVVYEQMLMGWSYWDTNNKCHRFPFDKKPTSTPGIKDGEKLKELYALGVYNYDTKRLEVWEITQATIKQQLFDYWHNEEYGKFTGYGLSIKRTGSGLKTEYGVVAGVPKPLPAEIQALADAKPINLQALIDGGNPFDSQPKPGAAPTAEQTQTQAADDSDLPF